MASLVFFIMVTVHDPKFEPFEVSWRLYDASYSKALLFAHMPFTSSLSVRP